MKVRNIRLIGVSLLLLVIASLYIYAKVPNAENKDATEQEKFEVAATFDEIAMKNNLDPKIFKVKVSNNDSPDW